MNIKKTVKKSLILGIEGRLDTETSPALAEEIKGVFDEYEKLTLDLRDTEYISSAGLRVILTAQKESLAAKKAFTLTNVGKNNMELFDITGFLDILTIE